MVIFTLDTPTTVGTLANQITVSALGMTAIRVSSTPALAPMGSGEMEIILTETTNGWQTAISYQDASVFDLLEASIDAGASMGSTLASTIFAKLVADGKLPPGSIGADASAATVQTSKDNDVVMAQTMVTAELAADAPASTPSVYFF
jgi:hypothetical protein